MTKKKSKTLLLIFLLTPFSLIFGGAAAVTYAFLKDVDSEMLFVMGIISCLTAICIVHAFKKKREKWI
jgi:hypothetical protein